MGIGEEWHWRRQRQYYSYFNFLTGPGYSRLSLTDVGPTQLVLQISRFPHSRLSFIRILSLPTFYETKMTTLSKYSPTDSLPLSPPASHPASSLPKKPVQGEMIIGWYGNNGDWAYICPKLRACHSQVSTGIHLPHLSLDFSPFHLLG